MKLNEKSKQIIFEIVPIILFALALVIRFAVDIEMCIRDSPSTGLLISVT